MILPLTVNSTFGRRFIQKNPWIPSVYNQRHITNIKPNVTQKKHEKENSQ